MGTVPSLDHRAAAIASGIDAYFRAHDPPRVVPAQAAATDAALDVLARTELLRVRTRS